MPDWTVTDDVLCVGPLRVSCQRMARSHWHPSDVLRAWGSVPLHRLGDQVALPCAVDEVVWIGAWIENGLAEAGVSLWDDDDGARGQIFVPSDFQLTYLADHSGPRRPIWIPPGTDERVLRLDMSLGTASVSVELRLVRPDAWAVVAGRACPGPLAGPPEPPPRLG